MITRSKVGHIYVVSLDKCSYMVAHHDDQIDHLRQAAVIALARVHRVLDDDQRKLIARFLRRHWR